MYNLSAAAAAIASDGWLEHQLMTELKERLPPAAQPTLTLPDKKARRSLFNRIDVNGNGGISLAGE